MRVLLLSLVCVFALPVVRCHHAERWRERAAAYSGDHSSSVVIEGFGHHPAHSTEQRQVDDDNIQERISDVHVYYDSVFYPPGPQANDTWFELENRLGLTLSNGYRLYAVTSLPFSFPFYGHYIDQVAITTGGFLYTGTFYHPYVNLTQFIAPLLADFNPSLNDTAQVLLYCSPDRFTIQWDMAHSQNHVDAGPFTFQVSLFPSGLIHFAYREIPLSVRDIDNDDHPVEVGLADAYYINRTVADPDQGSTDVVFIYEYSRVELNSSSNLAYSAYVITPRPNCVTASTCNECKSLSSTMDFECGWCDSRSRCSDSFNRNRQDWLDSGCDTTSHLDCAGLSSGAIAGISVTGVVLLVLLLLVALLIAVCVYGYKRPESKQIQVNKKLPVKYEDSRPIFLEISQELADTAKDHGQRLILTPNDVLRMPWHAGYAETINAGKSLYSNEDQASIHVTTLAISDSDKEHSHKIPYVLFGIFDGHVGTGAALTAANALHFHIRDKLTAIKHFLAHEQAEMIAEDDPGLGCITEPIPTELLVTGSLEESFAEMDDQIRRERETYRIKGGCTAIVALFLQTKLYVACAGDCRAVLFTNNFTDIVEMSMDFTPETDRKRLQTLAYLQPQLLGKHFGRIEYQRRLRKKDIGQRVLFRDRHMSGWAYRSVSEDDVTHVPMITGHGKRARLMATIGAARGFGDHDLEAPGGQWIKPFLTPIPEVRVHDLSASEYGSSDVLVMACDGLWERLTNEEALECVKNTFDKYPHNERIYTQAANDLVLAARGTFGKKGWRTAKEQIASGDDITVFVVPLHMYHTVPKTGCLGEAMDNSDLCDPITYASGNLEVSLLAGN